jgi:hypothetical protein
VKNLVIFFLILIFSCKSINEIQSSFENQYILTKEEKIIFSAVQQKLLEEGYDFIARGN